jgi:pimeloyl-ACP methyl ester carboxylesterase
MLCMRAALLDAGAFSRVVDVHSPGPPAFRYAALHARLSLPPLRAILSAWVRRAPRKWAHKNVHYYDESLKSLEEAAEYGDPLATPDGAAAFIGHLRDVFAPSELRAFMRALEQPFPVPLLFVYSRQDPLVPPSIGELLHQKVPEAPLVWLEKTSHFAHVDTPEAVLQAILPFLSPPAAAAG